MKVQDVSGKLAYGARVWGPREDKRWGLLLGTGLKYVRESLGGASASTLLGDLGALYTFRKNVHVFGVGASARSLGRGFKFDTERDKPPTSYRGGLSYELPVLGDPLTLSLDMKSDLDSGTSFGGGMEYLLRRVVAWRVGYASPEGLGNGFRFGVGFHLKLFRLEYSLAQFGEFGFTHRMGVSVRFGEPVEILPVLTPAREKAQLHIERASRFTHEGRHLESILELNKALKLDPLNKEALQKMREAKERMEQMQ